MKQFIINKKSCLHETFREGIVRLTGDDFRYLVRVRRFAVGEYFPAVLPDGKETLIQILSIENGILTGRCSSVTTEDAAPDEVSKKLPPIILFQALAKGGKMDLIVRQAAESGITEIVPFISVYSIAKTDQGGKKFSRWERIIKEARQQSGSKIATTIRHPLKMDELFDYWKNIKEDGAASSGSAPIGAAGILFHHSLTDGSGRGLEQESLHSYLNIVPKTAVFAVGPEGGFSEAEVSLFLENGFKPMKIGDTILRTETAALYCAAAIKILLLERNSWELKQMNTNCAKTC